MNRLVLVASLLAFTGCKKKEEAKPADPAKTTEPAKDMAKDEPKVAEPAADEPKQLAEVEMVDHDLAPFGKAFEGYVVTAPKDAKIEFDDPSRQIVLSDTDFVSIGEAPYWEDSVKGLDKDKDNQNIKKVSDTEYRYERTPPLGKAWLVDTLVKVSLASSWRSVG